MEKMKQFLSQFGDLEQISMMDFINDVNHAIQRFSLTREQYLEIYDLLVRVETER